MNNRTLKNCLVINTIRNTCGTDASARFIIPLIEKQFLECTNLNQVQKLIYSFTSLPDSDSYDWEFQQNDNQQRVNDVEQYFIDSILCINLQTGQYGMTQLIEDTMIINGNNIFYE